MREMRGMQDDIKSKKTAQNIFVLEAINSTEINTLSIRYSHLVIKG